jgi:DNA-binding transcriptional ArsR family regulator
MPARIKPLARTENLLTEELDDELLVYDEHQQLACRLNRTAALVWRSADGKRTVADLVEVLREEVELADEDLVMVTLDRLEENGLIEAGYTRRDADDARVSRRRFIRRIGVVGTAALALPVVQSIVAPTPAAAQSGTCECKCYCFECGCVDECYCEPCDCTCAPSRRGNLRRFNTR